MPNRRALFEYIIPKIGSALGLNKDFTYEDFFDWHIRKKG